MLMLAIYEKNEYSTATVATNPTSQMTDLYTYYPANTLKVYIKKIHYSAVPQIITADSGSNKNPLKYPKNRIRVYRPWLQQTSILESPI